MSGSYRDIRQGESNKQQTPSVIHRLASLVAVSNGSVERHNQGDDTVDFSVDLALSGLMLPAGSCLTVMLSAIHASTG